MKTEIHSNQFLIVSLNKVSGTFSVGSFARIHPNYQVALHEAQRLASIYHDKKFIVVAVAAVAELRPIDNPVVTTYSI